MKGVFVTGSDTDVGKTYVSTQIARRLVEQGRHVVPRKPVESGCEKINSDLFPADAASLLDASGSSQSLEKVCAFRFAHALSPQLAARLAGTPLQLQQLTSHCLSDVKQDDFLLVEGAGGFLSPICESSLNADLASRLQLPVLLVVEDRLGAVNQALMALESIQHHKLDTLAVILNSCRPDSTPDQADNLTEIQQFTDTPVIQLPYAASLSQADLSKLFQ